MEYYHIRSNKYSLHERKLKSGKRVYDCVFTVFTIDGQHKQKWLRGFESKGLAKAGYLDFVSKHCEVVRRTVQKKNPEKEILLVGDLVKQYISTLGNVNKQSVIYDKVKTFDLYILPKYAKTPIDELTKEELYQWQDWLWSQKNSRTGAYYTHKYLMKIRAFFNAFLVWIEQRYSIKNNLEDVAKPKRRTPQKTMSFWTREQFETFIAVVDDPMYHALFTFMFFTGRRKGELFALLKGDISRDKAKFDKSVNRRTYGQKTWEITSTKANKTCTVPLCAPVREEIKRYTPPKDGQFYFGGKEPLPPATVDRAFKRYTQKAGLPQIRIHDLRHSFVSMLIHLGASVFTIAELISDNVEQVHKTYGHLYQEDKLDVIAKI